MTGDEEASLDLWRQGDIAFAPVEIPLIAIVDGEVVTRLIGAEWGVVVLSQSCDIIKPSLSKPYIQIAGLVPADPDEIERARSGQSPSRLSLPILKERGLVVDLEVSATVSKELVAQWVRTAGCQDDRQQRQFAAGLARHRQRFAFPNEFNDLIKPVRGWIESKRSANSAFGRFVQAILEIRAICDDWESPTSLVFLVILAARASADDKKDWDAALATLTRKGTHPAYPEPDFRMVTYDDISAAEFRSSDRLDWDGLSEAR